MGFFGVKFVTSCRDIIIFSTKTIFSKAQSANRIFLLCPFQRQNFIFNRICRQNVFPQKTIAPPPPFKLNGCSLNRQNKYT